MLDLPVAYLHRLRILLRGLGELAALVIDTGQVSVGLRVAGRQGHALPRAGDRLGREPLVVQPRRLQFWNAPRGNCVKPLEEAAAKTPVAVTTGNRCRNRQFWGMTDMLKYLGRTLSHYYGAIVQQPMPWRVIDRLVTLEEVEEKEVDAEDEAPEVISLEEAEEDAKPGTDVPDMGDDEDVDLGEDEDDTFLADEEEENDDVTDIIGVGDDDDEI